MRLYFLIIHLVLTPLFSCLASESPLWNVHEVEHILTEGCVTHSESMSTFLERHGKIVNYTSNINLVEFNDGTKAVFKIFDKDSQREVNEAYGEIVAYQASKMLGLAQVPPTIMREINGKLGSLQYYVDSDIDAQADDNYTNALAEANPEELQNLKIFYFLFGQWDVGPTNIVIKRNESKTHLIAIDNGNISHAQYVNYGELPFVHVRDVEASHQELLEDCPLDFPFDLSQMFYRPIGDSLHHAYKNKFPEEFYVRSDKSRAEFIRCVVFQNSLWRQYNVNDSIITNAFYTAVCSKKTYRTLKTLNKQMIMDFLRKSIPKKNIRKRFINPIYGFNMVDAILARKNLLLRNVKTV